MKNFSTWLLVMFIVMFAAFRIIVIIETQQGQSLGGVTSNNVQIEIGLMFVTLISLLFIVKRKLLGAILYSTAYFFYFGADLYNLVISGNLMNLGNALGLLSSGIGILLPLFVLFDTLLDKSRKINPVDKQTDWFYKNEQYDRKFDERADRNEYKF